VRIPEMNYVEDFESGDGGWKGAGFVRIQNILPQYFTISIIRTGAETLVESVKVDAGQAVSIPLELGENIRSALCHHRREPGSQLLQSLDIWLFINR